MKKGKVKVFARKAASLFLAICLIATSMSYSPKTVSAAAASGEAANETEPAERDSSGGGDAAIELLSSTDTGVATLASAYMEVAVDTKFPRVIAYNLKAPNAGKTFEGQSEKLDTIIINEVPIKPAVTSQIGTGAAITYTITAKDDAKNINAVLTAEFVVKENTLAFNITGIQDNGKIIKTIEIPNHSLVSVNSKQKGANLQAVTMSVNTHISGDREVLVNDALDLEKEKKQGYMYAFVSNENLSAGIWSNSDNDYQHFDDLDLNSEYFANSRTKQNQKVTATATEKEGTKKIGLSSTFWTYQRTEQDRKEDGTLEYLAHNKGEAVPASVDELPSCKIAIAADINGDQRVDWQDGAIAYRDIMNNPKGFERVPAMVAYRISMNFGSQAQNPFLMALDNVKKISLHTDGLGQSVLLKGYGSEGHDSGHFNYADIGQRIGGAEEMKVLLEKGKEYGATFGIHVNATETYPESKYFDEDRLRRNPDKSIKFGWNWIDQGVNMDPVYDMRTDRLDRWKDLYDELGGAGNDLDFIYIDVWGNGQNGDNGTWMSRQLAKEILAHNWRVSGEWGYAFENDSTFQHWATDLTYGGYSLQGINSRIAKFIRNHQKDSWIGNTTGYGGEADAPLLGAYNMRDFEGWQGRSDYAAYINTLYEVNLPAKFVQNFQVTNWTDGTPVTMTDNKSTYPWTPGMYAKLKSTKGNHTLEIQRKSNDFAADKTGYRTRTMTMDGKKIFEGQEGNESYLIPWLWKATDCEELPAADQKLYHWNSKGGTTSWDVPSDWTGSAMVYRLDDLGKQDGKAVSIVNGKITLTAEAKTPYVLHKGASENQDMTWSDGMKIVDSGFNSGSLDPWTISGDREKAKITRSQGSNPMLEIGNNTAKTEVSQKFTGLKPNTRYAVYVGMDNRSSSKAGISVAGGKKPVSNTAGRSIALNFIKAYGHATYKATSTIDNKSYFQHIYAYFETGSDASNVTVTLSKEAGEGSVYFDDLRVVENGYAGWDKWESQKIFTQDFEQEAQGIHPFVLSWSEDVEDNRIHLAEYHAPYTQRGSYAGGQLIKMVDDVIRKEASEQPLGDTQNWSVKINGTAGIGGGDQLVYQTIPQTFTFEPGAFYEVSFDYESGGEGTYEFVMGDGHSLEGKELYDFYEVEEAFKDRVEMGKTVAESDGLKNYKTFTYPMVAPESGEGWIGISATDKYAEIPDNIASSTLAYCGFSDFVLDNLVIKKSDVRKAALDSILKTARLENSRYYTDESWSAFAEALETANKAFALISATQTQVDNAAAELDAAWKALVKTTITKETLQKLIDRITADNSEAAYAVSVWNNFKIEVNFAKSVTALTSPSQKLLNKAYQDLVDAEVLLRSQKDVKDSEDPTVIAKDRFKVAVGSWEPNGGSSEGPAENAIDGNPNTIWHTEWSGTARENMWFEFALEAPSEVNGVKYLARGGDSNGSIYDYRIDISKDKGATWTPAANGTWSGKDTKWQSVPFDAQKGVTNVRIWALTSKGEFAAAAELRITEPLKEIQDPPTGFKAYDTYSGGSSGRINGTNSKMEYSTSANGEYTACRNSFIADLAVGDYYIRYKMTDTYRVSLPAKVAVLDTMSKPSEPSGPSGGGSTPQEPGAPEPGGDTVRKEEVTETETSKTVTTTTETKKADGSKEVVVDKQITDKVTGEVVRSTAATNTSAEKDVTVKVIVTSDKTDAKVSGEAKLDANKNVVSANITIESANAESKAAGTKAEINLPLADAQVKQAVADLKEASGNAITKPIDVKLEIPNAEIVKQLADKAIKDVAITIGVPEKSKDVNVSEIVLPKEVLDSAKSNVKNLKAMVKDSKGKIVASWDIKGEVLKQSKQTITSLNLAVDVSAATAVLAVKPNTKAVMAKDKKNAANKVISVSFGQGKTLPSSATVTVPVAGTNGAKAGDTVYLFNVNPKTKKYDYVPNNTYKVAKDGTIALKVIKGTDYVLLPAKPDGKAATTLANQISLASGSQTVSKGKSGQIKVSMPVFLKNVANFSKKSTDKAVLETKTGYASTNSKVAEVDKNGRITGKKAGKATITTTITLKNNTKKVIKSTITVK